MTDKMEMELGDCLFYAGPIMIFQPLAIRALTLEWVACSGVRPTGNSVFALRLVSAELVGKEVGPPVLTQGEKERH